MNSTDRVHADVMAVIPARGGSKGVPGKNRARVGGVPLVTRAIRACLAAPTVTRVVVSTDDDAIAELAEVAGATVVRRPPEISGDTATSESALLHAMHALYGEGLVGLDTVLLVQCTSPFITPAEVDAVARAVRHGSADSAFTGSPTHGFLWRRDAEGAAFGVNHDHSFRPRRQDRPQEYLETGAAYAMNATGFASAGHRFFGRIELVETDPGRVLEIDEPNDLERARAIAELLDDAPHPVNRRDIDAVVLDFDGVQTDDRVWITSDGREQVAVHRGDGMGIAALRDAGIPVLVLSTEVNDVVAARARKLRIACLYGVGDKAAALREWCVDREVDLSRVVYVGNDVNDLSCMHSVGWPVAVAGAHDEVRATATWITTTPGGFGAVREVAAWILGKDLQG